VAEVEATLVNSKTIRRQFGAQMVRRHESQPRSSPAFRRSVFDRLLSPIPFAFLQSLLAELFLLLGREHPALWAVKPF
jgi:hypothetical protein